MEPGLGNTVNLTQDLPRATCLGSPLPSLALCLPPEEVVCLGLQVISAVGNGGCRLTVMHGSLGRWFPNLAVPGDL